MRLAGCPPVLGSYAPRGPPHITRGLEPLAQPGQKTRPSFLPTRPQLSGGLQAGDTPVSTASTHPGAEPGGSPARVLSVCASSHTHPRVFACAVHMSDGILWLPGSEPGLGGEEPVLWEGRVAGAPGLAPGPGAAGPSGWFGGRGASQCCRCSQSRPAAPSECGCPLSASQLLEGRGSEWADAPGGADLCPGTFTPSSRHLGRKWTCELGLAAQPAATKAERSLCMPSRGCPEGGNFAMSGLCAFGGRA